MKEEKVVSLYNKYDTYIPSTLSQNILYSIYKNRLHSIAINNDVISKLNTLTLCDLLVVIDFIPTKEELKIMNNVARVVIIVIGGVPYESFKKYPYLKDMLPDEGLFITDENISSAELTYLHFSLGISRDFSKHATLVPSNIRQLCDYAHKDKNSKYLRFFYESLRLDFIANTDFVYDLMKNGFDVNTNMESLYTLYEMSIIEEFDLFSNIVQIADIDLKFVALNKTMVFLHPNEKMKMIVDMVNNNKKFTDNIIIYYHYNNSFMHVIYTRDDTNEEFKKFKKKFKLKALLCPYDGFYYMHTKDIPFISKPIEE